MIEMYGPCEGITHDQRMLRESRLLERVLQFCVLSILVGPARVLVLFYLFADRGYVHGNPALQVLYKGAGLQPYKLQYNEDMSKIRQPVEWSFGKIGNLFAFVDFEKNKKAVFAACSLLLANRGSLDKLPFLLVRQRNEQVFPGSNAGAGGLCGECVLIPLLLSCCVCVCVFCFAQP